MPVPRNTSRAETVTRGIHEYLVIDSVPAAASSALIGTFLKDASLTVDGTYDCYVDVPGVASLDIYLKPAATSGTVTPSAFITYADKATLKTAVTGFSAFAGAITQQTGTAALKGEQRVIVRIVLATGTLTFTRAEVNGL